MAMKKEIPCINKKEVYMPKKKKKKKKKFFGANLNINRWERYVNYKAVQCLSAQTVVIRS